MKKKLVGLLFAMTLSLAMVACGDQVVEKESDMVEAEVEDTKADDKKEEKEEESKLCPEGQHVMSLRTLEAPMTCEKCGYTEGEAVQMTITETHVPDGDAEVHLIPKGYATHQWTDEDLPTNTITVYDKLGNQTNQLTLKYDGESAGWGCWYYGAGDYFYIVAVGVDACGAPETYMVLDEDGNKVKELSYDETFYAAAVDVDGNPAFYIENDVTGEAGFTYVKTGEKVEDPTKLIIARYVEDESGQWDSVSRSANTDYYFCGRNTEDGDSEWGFLDADMNVVMTYKDVCDFNSAGYALATDDRESYYIIDKDFNVVSDKCITANSAVYSLAGDYIYTLVGDSETGTYSIVIIE